MTQQDTIGSIRIFQYRAPLLALLAIVTVLVYFNYMGASFRTRSASKFIKNVYLFTWQWVGSPHSISSSKSTTGPHRLLPVPPTSAPELDKKISFENSSTWRISLSVNLVSFRRLKPPNKSLFTPDSSRKCHRNGRESMIKRILVTLLNYSGPKLRESNHLIVLRDTLWIADTIMMVTKIIRYLMP